MFEAAVRFVSQALGDFGLPVETQAVVAALRDEMQMAPDRPQEILAFLEDGELVASERPLLRQFVRRIGGVEKLGDPEKCVEIAKPTLAVLDIRLNKIPAFT